MDAQQLNTLVDKAARAQKTYQAFSPQLVDKIVEQATCDAQVKQAIKAFDQAVAGLADSQGKSMPRCGTLADDTTFGLQQTAEPLGIICAQVPATDPTATIIAKTLLALKSKHAVILTPDPSINSCTIELARIIREAAFKLGAPRDLICWIDEGD